MIAAVKKPEKATVSAATGRSHLYVVAQWEQTFRCLDLLSWRLSLAESGTERTVLTKVPATVQICRKQIGA